MLKCEQLNSLDKAYAIASNSLKVLGSLSITEHATRSEQNIAYLLKSICHCETYSCFGSGLWTKSLNDFKTSPK